MTMNINEIDAKQFSGTAFFAITLRRAFGNRAKIKSAELLERYLRDLQAELDAAGDDDKKAAKTAVDGLSPAAAAAMKNTKRISANKVLVNSPALDALLSKMTDIKNQCLNLCMPSYIREGLFVAKLETIPAIEQIVAEGRKVIETELLPAVLAEYPVKKQEAKDLPLAKGGLGCLYNEGDYMTERELSDSFEIVTNWLSLSVAEGLPPELRAAENAKLQAKYADAAQEIQAALRVMFSELIDHATEKLTVNAGDKPKIFRDTLVTNIAEFCDTFSAKNIIPDAQLAALVAKAKQVIASTDAEKLRKFANVRDQTANALAEIKKQLEPMVKAGRRFDFTEEEATPAAAA